MAIPVDESLLGLLSLTALALALVLSLAVLGRHAGKSTLAPLRERFVYGVPWGTVLVIVSLYLVYYLLQGGGEDGGAVVVGFRSWSVWYPQGLFLSSFAHSSDSHLAGNVLGTIAFSPIVEYAWGHYGSADEVRWNYLPDRPAGRIGVFVGGVVLVGILGSLFVPGAVIGFSGVVFAFAGFTIVSRPVAAIFAIVGVRALHLVRDAVQSPWVIARARPRFVSPGWANVALQGHLLGLLVGALLAIVLVRLRDDDSRLLYVWFAALVFAVTRSMYAVYWYLGADSFVLYRAIGAAGVFVLATLIAVAASPTRRLVGSLGGRSISGRTVATAALILTVCAISMAGMLYNVADVDSGPAVEDGIEVNEYTVAYAEDAENQYIAGVKSPVADSGTSVTVSGVIVASDENNAWELSTSANRLAFEGAATIPVGGPLWRETVYVNRTEWDLVDGNTTYKVFGTHGDEPRKLLYADDPAVGKSVVNGTNVSIRPAEPFYELVLSRNGSVRVVERIPARNESVTLEDAVFERKENDLIVHHAGTEFRLATYRRSGRSD